MNTLFDCLKKGTAPQQVVAFAREYLREEGFEELYYDRLFSPLLSGRYFITLPDGVVPLPGSYVYVISRYVDAGIITAARSFVALPLPGIPEFDEAPDNTMSVIRILGVVARVVVSAAGS